MIIDKYLYEIIEDYKSASSEKEQIDIFQNFCSLIWSSSNKRRVYIKTIKFNVKDDLLDSEIGQIFNTWSIVEYVGYKATSNEVNWCNLIRQKINNLYTRYFDEEVILKKDYINLLKTPYNLYYRWIKGTEMNPEELSDIIETSMNEANNLKIMYQKQKMKMSWEEYKDLIEKFLQKIFDNCELIEDYEIENLTNKYIYELANEDNSYVKSICNSLDGYMRNYQKEYYGLKRGRNKQYVRCQECGVLIEKTNNRIMYCKDCAKRIDKNKAKIRMKNIRN